MVIRPVVTCAVCLVGVLAGAATPRAATPRVSGELELLAGYRALFRDEADENAFVFDRGRLGVGLELAALRVGLRAEGVRSVDADSQFGVAGNSVVLRVDRAWVGGSWRWGDVRLDGALGIVGDPWIGPADAVSDVRGLRAGLVEGGDFAHTADLGAWVAVGMLNDRLALEVAALNGQGHGEIELNASKDLYAGAVGRPWQGELFGAPAEVRVAVAWRDGSVGAGDAANRRLHASLAFAGAPLRVGTEVVWAMGYGGQGDRDALGVAAWIAGEPIPAWLGVAARFDRVDAAMDDDTVRQSVVGGVYCDPWRALGPPGSGHGRLWLLAGAEWYGADAGAVGGVPGASDVWWIEVRADVSAVLQGLGE